MHVRKKNNIIITQYEPEAFVFWGLILEKSSKEKYLTNNCMICAPLFFVNVSSKVYKFK